MPDVEDKRPSWQADPLTDVKADLRNLVNNVGKMESSLSRMDDRITNGLKELKAAQEQHYVTHEEFEPIKEGYVTREEFEPWKKFVYLALANLVASIIGGLVYLLIHSNVKPGP